jgi:hypothetical protein
LAFIRGWNLDLDHRPFLATSFEADWLPLALFPPPRPVPVLPPAPSPPFLVIAPGLPPAPFTAI